MPKGLVGMEFGEWMRLRAIPRMQAATIAHFNSRSAWFNPAKYKALKDALGWERRGLANKPCYLLSCDSDSRHYMTDMWEFRRTRVRRDRREIPEGEQGWVDIDKCQYVPSAPRVPDTIQQPIEAFFGVVKRKAYAAYNKAKGRDWRAMYNAVIQVYEKDVPDLNIAAFFRHAKIALRVFAGTPDEWVEHRGHIVNCTRGDWVPSRVSA